MRTNHLWFGDSWVIGSELYKEPSLRTGSNNPEYKGFASAHLSPKYVPNATFGYNIPNFVFARKISDTLGAKHWNFGMSGGSISYSLYNLYEWIQKYPEELEHNNIVFLGTTAQSRDFARTDEDYCHYHQNIQRHAENHKVYFKNKLRPTIPFSEYESTKTINEMYSVCKAHNIKFYIFNVWGPIQMYEEINLVPDECWLTKKTNALFDLTTGTSFVDILGMPVTKGTTENEYKAIEFVVNKSHPIHKKYIHPCQFHPNLYCHEQMANTLLEILDAS
jgi:hypothetical protein